MHLPVCCRSHCFQVSSIPAVIRGDDDIIRSILYHCRKYCNAFQIVYCPLFSSSTKPFQAGSGLQLGLHSILSNRICLTPCCLMGRYPIFLECVSLTIRRLRETNLTHLYLGHSLVYDKRLKEVIEVFSRTCYCAWLLNAMKRKLPSFAGVV